MKKIAQKKSSKKVTIPPDILKDKISNENPTPPIDSPKEEIVEPVELINDDNTENSQEEVSFYEKVTGEKPPKKEVPDIDINSPLEIEKRDQDDSLPQIEKMNKKLFLLGGVVFLLTIVVTTIIGLFIFNTSTTSKVEDVEETKEQAVIPSPTPAELDRAIWTFEVLNGSGEPGKAKKTADAIEAIGYTVDRTGNAKDSDYTGVTVSFIKEIDDATKSTIISELEKEFQSIKEEEEPSLLSDSSILLIIGK